MIYISFTLLYLNYFASDKEGEHFKKLLNKNYGDFMVDENPFMMVFFYNMQSLALTFVTFRRLQENQVFFMTYFDVGGENSLNLATNFLKYFQFVTILISFVICIVLFARGTSTKLLLTKKIALSVAIFASFMVLIHLISIGLVLRIYKFFKQRASGVASPSVLVLNVIMSMASQILIFASYYTLYKDKKGFNEFRTISDSQKNEKDLDPDIEE